jgi:hypothetical protein
LQPFDASVIAREQRTLANYGFMPREGREIGGVWFMKEKSFCRPDIDKMRERAAADAAAFKAVGHSVDDILFCELTDEPTGQRLEVIAKDAAYQEAFRNWLQRLGLTPAELLVSDWEGVRIVTEAEKNQFPALYYFSQRFRTRALGDFMATQRKVLEQAYGRTLPVLANFSDGAIYQGNFYAQGVDYFELLSAPDQNAIWGEDWANGSSTYQCASYNVDLMRAAGRERKLPIGHHLISYAGRKPWDVKLKATSELARGVKILNSFFYGPSWASHEGGAYWRSHAWYAKPPMWRATAELTREIGAVEDLLIGAMPAPAQVAILYSSASDVWTIDSNLAPGFDRMHTWLALAHAQVPVDVISEQQAADGALKNYKVCYFSGPNLTRSAAAALRPWVEQGGTLWLTAGAAERDEYNRPLTTLEDLLPAGRGELQQLQAQSGSGRTLSSLAAKDTVQWSGGKAEVLSLKQPLAARPGAKGLAAFSDQSPAAVLGTAGRGRVYCVGFLPALSYIKPALAARAALVAAADEKAKADAGAAAILDRSANPWAYPADIRDFLLLPVQSSDVELPIACDVPLVDAVFMTSDLGVLVPLANYTLESIPKVSLRITTAKPIARVESARLGPIPFVTNDRTISIALPLETNDFIKLYYR